MNGGTREPSRTHEYHTTVTWTGNRGTGTQSYLGYDRAHDIATDGRPVLFGSSESTFNGDPSRWNPELLFLASASQCHMLWFLHLASTNGVVVLGYEDTAEGVMVEDADGGGRFTAICLRPVVTVSEASMTDRARRLHAEASGRCFIANSLNFNVSHEPLIQVSDTQPPPSLGD